MYKQNVFFIYINTHNTIRFIYFKYAYDYLILNMLKCKFL